MKSEKSPFYSRIGVVELLLVLAILFAWRYPITREKHRATCEALAEG